MANSASLLPKRIWLALSVVITIYITLAGFTTQRLYFSRALDEGYHLEYITFIKQKGRLPINYEERAQITRADFPPLYHLAVTSLSSGVTVEDRPEFKFFWDTFRYRVIDFQGETPWMLTTEDFQPPYVGRFLVWQIGRWLSVTFSVGTIIIVFLTLSELPLPGRPVSALVGAAMLAFIPRFLILSSALNDDNLLGFIAALYFWLLVILIKRPARWWPLIGIGLVLGLSITVKYSLVLVPVELVTVLALLSYRQPWGWSGVFKRVGVVLLLTMICSSWWFGWNLYHLNTVSSDGWLVGLTRPLLVGGNDTTLNRLGGLVSSGQAGLTALPENTQAGSLEEWLRVTFTSLWGFALANRIPFEPYVYWIIFSVILLAVVGLVHTWRTNAVVRPWLALLSFHVGLFVVLPLIRFGLTRRLGVAAQGRHILVPAAAAIVALLVWGLSAIIPHRWRTVVYGTLLIGLLFWSGAHLYRLVTVATPVPLPMRSIEDAAADLATPANVRFDEVIELVSYEIDPRPRAGQLKVTLGWRSLQATNENYLLELFLIDDAGKAVSHWIGHHGGGRVPTLAWTAGDSVFDRLVLPLPLLPAGQYELRLSIKGESGPLLTADGSNVLILTSLSTTVSSEFDYSNEVHLQEEHGLINILFSVWNAKGAVDKPSPEFRYPNTITVVVNQPVTADEMLIELVDSEGKIWSPAMVTRPIYSFVIGARWPSGDYRLRVSRFVKNELASERITDPILTVNNWWPRHFSVPDEMQASLPANFANQVYLLGYTVPESTVKPGEAFPITLYWQAPERSPQANFIQFNTLLDSTGTPSGGYERLPLEYYSTLLWAPGEVVVDGYAVPVDPDAPPGEYYLNVGYYLPVGEAAVNLPLVEDGQMSKVTSVTIGPVEVIGDTTKN